jgi:alpha-tubulin suppressor-like RCC1 family protein
MNWDGQLGDGSATSSLAPVPVSTLQAGVIAVTAGAYHSCALTVGGAVLCWGSNDAGQLGNGTLTGESVPVPVSGLPLGIAAIAAGDDHTCAVTAGGGALCWGRNQSGQLGNGSTASSSIPVAVAGLSTGLRAISARDDHTCAVTVSGGVLCWGRNQSGQLGNGGTTDSSVPVAVSGLSSGVAAIAAGGSHSCAVRDVGDVLCWGPNAYGQLGDGMDSNSSVPVPLSGLPGDAIAITAGWVHSCALTTSGAAFCWGANSNGQLGSGGVAGLLVPVEIPQLSNGVASLALGAVHSCAVTTAGGVLCWGANFSGQLGNGSRTTSTIPVAVLGLSTGIVAVAVSAGFPDAYSCALAAGGGILCWGTNGYGQLGNGSTSDSAVPIAVSGLPSGVVSIVAGTYHACALTSTGDVWCWGVQLANGSTSDSAVPIAVSGLPSGIVSIVAGASHTCVLTSSAEVWCWGYRLGNGSTLDSAVPFVLSGLPSGVVSVSAGAYHGCALIASGAVWCWGYNDYSQLGNADYDDSYVPVEAWVLPTGVTAMALGVRHSCALRENGEVLCWGAGGALGNGQFNDRWRPVAVAELPSEIAAISAGWAHSCAIATSGEVLCWGSNFYGERGDGSSEQNLLPLPVVGLGGGVVERVPSIGAVGFLVLATTMLALGAGAARRRERAILVRS